MSPAHPPRGGFAALLPRGAGTRPRTDAPRERGHAHARSVSAVRGSLAGAALTRGVAAHEFEIVSEVWWTVVLAAPLEVACSPRYPVVTRERRPGAAVCRSALGED